MIDEGEEPGRTDMGNGRKRARQADYGGDSCGAGSCLRYGTAFCGGKNHCAAACGGEGVLAYLPWLLTAFGGFLLRTVLYNGALGISHRATFSILKTIREKLLAKLPRLPLGTVMDTSSGKLKEIIVDQVDSMETTLAHLFPDMTANIVTPLLTVIYLFVLDWRLALLSLAVFPIAFVFMMTVMGGYAKNYAGAVKATTEMSSTMIEYINGIEVILRQAVCPNLAYVQLARNGFGSGFVVAGKKHGLYAQRG